MPAKIYMLYFSYGSNLYPARLHARAPSARLVTTGFSVGHRLAFHKLGQDGSAKCDAPPAKNHDARVYGALYHLGASDMRHLDRVEGLGAGYDKAILSIVTKSGPLEAFAYLAQPGFIDPRLQPFHWYKRLVFAGARYHCFPESYRADISAVESIPDPQPDRAADNLSVLC